MKSQKCGHGNKWVFWKHFIKKIVSDMSSASQWKRCFTNPDSWTKWNIFSALFLGLELSIPTPRDTPHHICLPHIGRTRKTRIFLQKCCGFLGVPRPAESESDSCASIYLTEPGASPRTHPRGFYPAAPYPMGILLVFGSSEGKATNPSSKPRLEVWDSRRGTTEKAKWFPWALAQQVWGVLLCGKGIPLQVSSQYRKKKKLGKTWQLQVKTEAAPHQSRTRSNQETLQRFAVKKK